MPSLVHRLRKFAIDDDDDDEDDDEKNNLLLLLFASSFLLGGTDRATVATSISPCGTRCVGICGSRPRYANSSIHINCIGRIPTY